VVEVLGDWTGCGAVAFGFELCDRVGPPPVPPPAPLAVPLSAGEGEALFTAEAG
jgi:hypothetical protein